MLDQQLLIGTMYIFLASGPSFLSLVFPIIPIYFGILVKVVKVLNTFIYFETFLTFDSLGFSFGFLKFYLLTLPALSLALS